MDKKEKIARLAEISASLKKDFIGIDNVIDQIIESITPWYVTPEIIERPIVVSVWGLTGTGKTSVVRRLIDLLDYRDNSLIFDCGAEESNDSSISDKISDFFSYTGGCGDGKELTGVFLFDEFQYARTLDEDGREISKASQRSIWNLIDSGLIDIVVRPYEVKELMTYVEELDYLADDIGRDLPISGNVWPESVMEKVKSTLDFYKTWRDNESDEDDEDEEDGDEGPKKKKKEKKPSPIISKGKKEILINRLNSIERGLGYKVVSEIDRMTTLDDLISLVKRYTRLVSRPKCINCSKALVFVIGNLDEAFSEVTNTDPDMDADVFAKIIKKTGILDVKEALKRRFRPEQIGRLGNNMIIYPSLKKSDFKGIIDLELGKVINKFKEVSGITLEFTDSFKDLIYSEGVYPSQGVRPVFTTIGTVCLPKLSKILSDPEGPKEKVTLECVGSLLSSEVTVRMTYDNGTKSVELQEKLELGRLRSKDSCKKLAAHAVHEAGHAVLMMIERQKYPEMVLAQSSVGGGYTYESLDDDDRISAMCKAEVDSEIRISLAGKCAEHLFFEDSKCTIGCTSDYDNVWSMLSRAAYKGGFFNHPYPWLSKGTPEGLPQGMIDENHSRMESIIGEMKEYLEKKYEETTNILKENKKLLTDIAKYLVENRCMFSDELKVIAEKNGLTLGEDPENYWFNKLYK